MAETFNYSSILAPYMRILLEVKESAGYSELRMKWILKEFDDFALQMQLNNPHITSEFISKWRATRTADCERTLYAKYSIWHQLTTTMARNGCACYIPRMPAQPQSDFTPYIFSVEQISAIFTCVDNLRLYDIRMSTALFSMPAIFRLLYSTGMRVSEALSLTNEDVNVEMRYIHLRKTKNGSDRYVAICDSLYHILTKYIEYRGKMPLATVSDPKHLFFIKCDGTGIQAGAVYTTFRKILAKCNIAFVGNHQGPRVHDLRHTSAVHALVQMERSGVDLYTGLPILSASLGHHSLSATEQYVRLTYAMYPDIEQRSSPINAFVYPKTCKAYDYDD